MIFPTMSFSMLASIFPVWLHMLVPMSQATIQVFLCTANLRRQLCHFRIQIALGWNWLSRVEMQQGMVGGRVGFLVAGLWEGVRCIIEKVIFRPAIFCMLPFNVASHLCCYFGVFAFFSCPRRSRTSQRYREALRTLFRQKKRLANDLTLPEAVTDVTSPAVTRAMLTISRFDFGAAVTVVGGVKQKMMQYDGAEFGRISLRRHRATLEI